MGDVGSLLIYIGIYRMRECERERERNLIFRKKRINFFYSIWDNFSTLGQLRPLLPQNSSACRDDNEFLILPLWNVLYILLLYQIIYMYRYLDIISNDVYS